MSEYGEGDDTLEETTAAAANNSANNSIIGKVRTGVTSILPNSLSKWFSPSTNKSESSNGNKRRHNEGDAYTPTSLPQRRIIVNEYDDDDDEADDDLDGEHGANVSNVRTNTGLLSSVVQPRRSLNTSLNDEPPPMKKSRMTFDGSMLNSRPLVASTPAVNVQRTMSANHYSRFSSSAATRSPNKREPGYNFFSDTAGASEFERRNANTDIIDLLIPMSSGSSETMPETNNNQLTQMEPASSRRTLNIPSSTTAASYSSGNSGLALSSLKRQSLSSVKGNSNATTRQQPTENNNILSDINVYDNKNESISLDPALELDDVVLQAAHQQTYNGQVVQSKFHNGNDDFFEATKYRPSSQPTDSDAEQDEDEETDVISDLPIKRARHLAAGTLKTETKQQQQQQQRSAGGPTSGLFNMSMSSSMNNSRNGSRTSSFGNGLNFDTHLEGRKSLFAGGSGSVSGVGIGGNRTNVKSALGNSTLSLNSLSRRQFNASIYGSTSALSDSRLLNATTSPFYKGNTTYGGAAAYRKYPTPARLTPTMMRPLSSLSTLSSSNNSLAGGERNTITGVNTSAGGAVSAPVLSGSAKFIFDALNDMTTPILDAKKMASSLQQQRQQQQLNAGSVSLQQVSKPYMRPTVMLRPKNSLKSSTQDTSLSSLPPPIRELQVPSMSQLLTMKKQFQNSTERSRQIAMQKATNQTYAMQTPAGSAAAASSSSSSTATSAATTKFSIQPTISHAFHLPTTSNSTVMKQQQSDNNNISNMKMNASPSDITNDVDLKQQQLQQQQKHVNKIRHKINNTRNAPDCVENEPSLLPVDLPQILFPVMKEMPKIDIGLPPPPPAPTAAVATSSSSATLSPPFGKAIAATSNATVTDVTMKSYLNSAGFKFSPPARLTDAPQTVAASSAAASMNFQFCEPISLATTTTTTNKSEASSSILPIPTTNQAVPPPLKTGSCLDALKPKSPNAQTSFNAASSNSFGEQFKKVAGEWDCDACMVRNKSIAQKCVACDTPRKGSGGTTTAPTTTFTSSSASGFGDLFKKQAGEWECDACMLRNKPDATKCISCETARKTNKPPTMNPLNAVAVTTDTGFKAIVAAQKSSSWECDSCMTRNDATRLKCACCEQAKPGCLPAAAKPTTSFMTPAAATAPKADDDFKAIAAKQAAAKWECEACMTRNESTRTKCVCCEQAKPGSGGAGGGNNSGNQQSESTAPKFSFGTTAAAKFSFGFGAGNENELRAKTTTTGITAQPANTTTTSTSVAKTEGTTVGFTFGVQPAQTTTTSTANKGFSFGLKSDSSQKQEATTVDGKDASDGNAKPKGFTFGLGTSAAAVTTNVAANTTTTTKSLEPSSTSSSLSTATTTATVTPFSFGSLTKVATTTTTSSETSNPILLANSKPTFSFGLTQNTQKTSESSNATATTAVTTTAAAASSTTTGSANIFGQQAFSFGVKPTSTTTTNTSAATTTTTTAANLPSFNLMTDNKPSLTFGVKATATTTASSSNVISTTTTTNSGFGSGSGFNFPMPTKPMFGLTPTTSAPTTTNANAPIATTASTTFGTFGSPKIASSNSNSTTASTTFGGFQFGATKTTDQQSNQTNLFGKPTIQDTQAKPIASATPIFGNAAAAGATNPTSQNATTTSMPPMPTATSNSPFSNSSSLFGGIAQPPAGTAPKPVFGDFGSSNSTTPTIGNASTAPAASSSSLFGAAPAFGSNNISTVTTFGAPATASNNNNSTNLFGNTNTPVAAAAAGVPQFGSANPNPPPAFGSSTTTFGGFGGATAQQQPSSVTNTPSNAATPFQFGAQNTNSGGFNFGANAAAARPAFNFTANNQQPSFNFTGSSTESNQNASRPFQFGAPAALTQTAFGNPTAAPASSSTMLFNFGGAQTSTESNTPFQFSGGNPSQPTNNIFAPSASNTAQSSAAARRRVRVPTRRLTPR